LVTVRVPVSASPSITRSSGSASSRVGAVSSVVSLTVATVSSAPLRSTRSTVRVSSPVGAPASAVMRRVAVSVLPSGSGKPSGPPYDPVMPSSVSVSSSGTNVSPSRYSRTRSSAVSP
jgi:hypothetical protein